MQDKSLSFVFLRLSEEIGPEIYTLVAHLLTDTAFVISPFEDQGAILAHALRSNVSTR